ncbi:hypothetical protein [Novosphingobium sp.]|uniref:putative barnase/colicin E5 family endoribonuclease n=1 Tax=Novosphingobium sp. TaxID=1874826 RepID=UPI0038B97D12
MSIIAPSPTEPMSRPTQAGNDLDAVKSTGWFDSANAARRVAVDEIPFQQQRRIQEAYLPVIKAVAEATGKSAAFGYISASRAAWALLPFTNSDATDYDSLWADIDMLRKSGRLLGGLPTDRAQFENGVLTRNGQRAVDQIKASQGSFSSRIAGGVVAGMADPTQVGLAIATGGAGSGLSVSRAALVQGLVNAGGAAFEMPATIAARERLGQDTSAVDVAAELGTAFVFGAVSDFAIHGVGATYRAGKSALAIPERSSPREVAKAFVEAVPRELRTPEQAAALNVIERDADLVDRNPFTPDPAGIDAHMARINAAQRAIVDPPEQLAARGAIHPVVAAVDEYLRAVKGSESGGNPAAQSRTSSASGLYGFTNGTWVATYKREFPNSGLSREAILARKGDVDLQDRLARRLTGENAEWLQRNGVAADPGNLYVVHHLGQGGAERVFRADPSARLEDILPAEVIAANPHMRGQTAGEFIAWARKRMGQAGDAPLPAIAPAEGDGVALADLMAQRPSIDVPRLARDQFPDDTSWRIAQSRVEAEALGLAEPLVTRETVWRDARVELQAAKEGEVFGALYHDATGPIDVKWGDERFGLAHIINKHPDVVDNLPAIIASTEVVPGRSIRNRLHLESPDHVVKVRLDWDDQSQHWLLTAFKKDKAPPATEDGGVAGLAQDHSPSAGAGQNIGRSPAEGKMAERRPDALGPSAVGVGLAETNPARRAGPEGDLAPAPPRGNEHGTRPVPAAPVEPLPDSVASRFSDPASADAVGQAESFTHDVKAFHEAGLYRDVSFETGGATGETVEQALARLADDDAAIAAMRGCL